MSKIEVDAIEPQSGTTLTIGASGDSVNIASGATITDFTSTGIDDNATSTAITIDSSENVGIGTASPTDTNGFGKALDIQGSTGAAIYVGSSGDRGIFGYTSGEQHISNPSASGTTRFYINGTEHMRINSAGAMLLGTTTAGSASAGDLVVNGGVFIGGTGTANLLDDYEEGSFTAEFSSSGATFTYSVRQGYYTKIGNIVIYNIYIQLDGAFTGTANAVTITGLPFTSTTLSTYASSSIAATRLVSFDSNFTSLEGRINPNTTSITLLENGGGQASNALTSDQLSNSSGQVFISGSYRANA
jgi:hypothetical protein